MYEHHKQPVISGRDFVRRMGRHGGWALLLLIVSMAIGMFGFHFLAKQHWIDALLNSAMLLGGMGPIGDMGSVPGKLFAAAFAIYAGLFFLICAGLFFAPIFHRIMHRFHLAEK